MGWDNRKKVKIVYQTSFFRINITLLFDSNLGTVMYRVMQVGSSGEVIELPQIVTGNFNTGSTQQAIINPLNGKHNRWYDFETIC